MQQAQGNGHPRPRILLVAMGEAGSDLELALAEHPRKPEVSRCANAEQSVASALDSRPDVILVQAEMSPLDGYEVVRRLVSEVPGASALLFAGRAGAEEYRRALQAGARDMIQIPLPSSELISAVDAAIEVSRAKRLTLETLTMAEPELQRAHGIACFSTKGGTGKTFLAVNLAAGLAQTGRRVALLDFDLQFGDAAIALGLIPERTIFDLVQTYTELDASLMSEFMLSHDSGLQLLPAPLFPDQADQITPDDIDRVLDVVREAYDFVVIDSPPFMEERILVALGWADTLLQIISMDLPSVKNLKVSLDALYALGFPQEKVRLVMNRADSQVGMSIEDAEKHVGIKVQHSIPSSVEVPRALNAGEIVLLSRPTSRVSRELAAIVDSFSGGTRAAQRGFRLLRRARKGS